MADESNITIDEKKERLKAYWRAYYRANKDKKRAYDLEYQAKNRDRILAEKREYAAATREKKRAYDKAKYAEWKAAQPPKPLKPAPTPEEIEAKREVYLAKARDRTRKWVTENAARKKEADSRYYAERRDQILEYSREYREKNASLIKERQRAAYYSRSDEQRRRALEASRELRARKRDYFNQKTRERRKENRDKHLESKKRYYRRNKDVHVAQQARRRAAKRNAEGDHKGHDRQRLRQIQKNKCAYCKVNLGKGGELDHIIPLARGGSNWPSNLQWLCEPCNRSKGALDPVDYAQKRGLLL
jgi:5-methylcytosine-specific restriction endonuclease McrA